MGKAFYMGPGVPHDDQLLAEAKDLLHSLQDIAKEENVSLSEITQVFQCLMSEYGAREMYQCADSITRLENELRNRD